MLSLWKEKARYKWLLLVYAIPLQKRASNTYLKAIVQFLTDYANLSLLFSSLSSLPLETSNKAFSQYKRSSSISSHRLILYVKRKASVCVDDEEPAGNINGGRQQIIREESGSPEAGMCLSVSIRAASTPTAGARRRRSKQIHVGGGRAPFSSRSFHHQISAHYLLINACINSLIHGTRIFVFRRYMYMYM